MPKRIHAPHLIQFNPIEPARVYAECARVASRRSSDRSIYRRRLHRRRPSQPPADPRARTLGQVAFTRKQTHTHTYGPRLHNKSTRCARGTRYDRPTDRPIDRRTENGSEVARG